MKTFKDYLEEVKSETLSKEKLNRLANDLSVEEFYNEIKDMSEKELRIVGDKIWDGKAFIERSTDGRIPKESEKHLSDLYSKHSIVVKLIRKLSK